MAAVGVGVAFEVLPIGVIARIPATAICATTPLLVMSLYGGGRSNPRNSRTCEPEANLSYARSS